MLLSAARTLIKKASTLEDDITNVPEARCWFCFIECLNFIHAREKKPSQSIEVLL